MNNQGWIKETNNSIWLTNKILICSICKAQKKLVCEIKDEGLYCLRCFSENLLNIFKDMDTLTIRGLEDIEFEKRGRKFPKKLNKSSRYFILKRDNFRCKACGNTSEISPLNVDHIIPKSKGGTDDESNLQTLCFDCNIGKGARW